MDYLLYSFIYLSKIPINIDLGRISPHRKSHSNGLFTLLIYLFKQNSYQYRLRADFLSSQKLLAAILLQKKSIMQVLEANIFNENFYCKNCLRVFSAMIEKPALGNHILIDMLHQIFRNKIYQKIR